MSQIERYSSKEQAAFTDFIKRRDIQLALFDLDDTLLDTHSLFKQQVGLFLQFCHGQIPNCDFDELRANYDKYGNESYKVMGVFVKRWSYVVNKLHEIYGEGLFNSGMGHLDQIYTMAPNVFEGAFGTLKLFQNSGLKMGLVTHASPRWTNIKLDTHNLRGYFDHIEIIDVEEHRFKTASHWQRAVDHFDIRAENVIGIGDNLHGDIEALSSLGVPNLVWIPSNWDVYRQGNFPDLPLGLIQARNISEVVPALASK